MYLSGKGNLNLGTSHGQALSLETRPSDREAVDVHGSDIRVMHPFWVLV